MLFTDLVHFNLFIYLKDIVNFNGNVILYQNDSCPFLFCSEFVNDSFPVDERGTMKSVVQYFQETYGFTIQHTNWPCLQVGNQQRPNYLPMEVSSCCHSMPFVFYGILLIFMTLLLCFKAQKNFLLENACCLSF